MNKKEYTEYLKQYAKELLDSIGTETEIEQRVIKLLYGFIRSGFLECRAGKGGAA